MSWSVTSTGTVPAVRIAIENHPSLPPTVKAAIIEVIDDIGASTDAAKHDSVRVEAYGHSGRGHFWAGIGKLEVAGFASADLELARLADAAGATPAS